MKSERVSSLASRVDAFLASTDDDDGKPAAGDSAPIEVDDLEGVEVSTATPNIVVDQPVEASLDMPTVVDKAITALGDSGAEGRAEEMARRLEAKVLDDPTGAAVLAYELGELYERRLADEARAV